MYPNKWRYIHGDIPKNPNSQATEDMIVIFPCTFPCTFQGPGQYSHFIVTKWFWPIKCNVWGKIGGL